MPFTKKIDRTARLLYVTAEGEIDRDDLAALQQSLIDAPEDAAGLDQIVDLTLVTRIDLTIDEMSALRAKSEEMRRLTRPGRLAIVAPTDITFGLARMYEMMFEGTEPPRPVLVVRKFTDAAAWLELPHGWVPESPPNSGLPAGHHEPRC